MFCKSCLCSFVAVAFVFLTCVINGPVWAVSLPYHVLSVPAEVYILPILPYDNGDLEPYITREMIETHYEGHHDAYRRKMNAALAAWREDVSMLPNNTNDGPNRRK